MPHDGFHAAPPGIDISRGGDDGGGRVEVDEFADEPDGGRVHARDVARVEPAEAVLDESLVGAGLHGRAPEDGNPALRVSFILPESGAGVVGRAVQQDGERVGERHGAGARHAGADDQQGFGGIGVQGGSHEGGRLGGLWREHPSSASGSGYETRIR